MGLPEYVLQCVQALERAGYQAWAVGGCVRDHCLGLTPQDYDLCTNALPEQTEAVFSGRKLILAGKKHGTVGVILGKNVVEITTFRTEGGYQDNRHPDWVKFVPNVEEDLARRDFTVNAMAWSPTRGYADPFGGRKDLEQKILRAVGNAEERFQEDSLRILRGIRFGARYGLTVEEQTEKAMLAQAPLMENLARERVFDELGKMLPLLDAEGLLRFGKVLAFAVPELEPMIGFDQRSPHHAYDVFTHTAKVVEAVPRDPALRWAALLHDVGKPASFTQDETGRGHFYGHAKVSAQMADAILLGLKAPNVLREEAVSLIEHHMQKWEPEKKFLRRRVSRLGWERVEKLLALQEADSGGKGIQEENPDGAYFTAIRAVLEEIREENGCLSLKSLAVRGNDLAALGLKGKDIGENLNWLLEQVMEEVLPNEKDALLGALKEKYHE